MIAPMDMIISAAMYHDIAAMKLRGKKQWVYILIFLPKDLQACLTT
jgi:hypothetical protein